MTLTLHLSEQLARRLAAEAARRGISVDEVAAGPSPLLSTILSPPLEPPNVVGVRRDRDLWIKPGRGRRRRAARWGFRARLNAAGQCRPAGGHRG